MITTGSRLFITFNMVSPCYSLQDTFPLRPWRYPVLNNVRSISTRPKIKLLVTPASFSMQMKLQELTSQRLSIIWMWTTHQTGKKSWSWFWFPVEITQLNALINHIHMRVTSHPKLVATWSFWIQIQHSSNHPRTDMKNIEKIKENN